MRALFLLLSIALAGCLGRVSERHPIYRIDEDMSAYFGPMTSGSVEADTNGRAVMMQVASNRYISDNSAGSKWNSRITDYSEKITTRASLTGRRFFLYISLRQDAGQAGPATDLDLSLQLDSLPGLTRSSLYATSRWSGIETMQNRKVRATPWPGGPELDCIRFTEGDNFLNGSTLGDASLEVKEVLFARNIGLVQAHVALDHPTGTTRVRRSILLTRRLN